MKTPHTRWTKREIRELELIYQKYPLEDVARRLGRSKVSVQSQAHFQRMKGKKNFRKYLNH